MGTIVLTYKKTNSAFKGKELFSITMTLKGSGKWIKVLSKKDRLYLANKKKSNSALKAKALRKWDTKSPARTPAKNHVESVLKNGAMQWYDSAKTDSSIKFGFFDEDYTVP